jgi:hypothetical protein
MLQCVNTADIIGPFSRGDRSNAPTPRDTVIKKRPLSVSDTGYSDCSAAAVESRKACIPSVPINFLDVLDHALARRRLVTKSPRTPRTPRTPRDQRSSFGLEPLDPGDAEPDLWTDWRERMKREFERSDREAGA